MSDATPRPRQARDEVKYAVNVFPITPSDSVDLSEATRAISLSVAGTVRITTIEGDVVNFVTTGLAIGIMHPIGVKRVHSTGTVATGIMGYV